MFSLNDVDKIIVFFDIISRGQMAILENVPVAIVVLNVQNPSTMMLFFYLWQILTKVPVTVLRKVPVTPKKCQ